VSAALLGKGCQEEILERKGLRRCSSARLMKLLRENEKY
jgi:hypothetical protein